MLTDLAVDYNEHTGLKNISNETILNSMADYFSKQPPNINLISSLKTLFVSSDDFKAYQMKI